MNIEIKNLDNLTERKKKHLTGLLKKQTESLKFLNLHTDKNIFT